VIWLTACGAATQVPEDLGSRHQDPVGPVVGEELVGPDRGRVRHVMREQLACLQDLETSLSAGRLDEAQALAFLIARTEHPLPQTDASARVSKTALDVARAPTLELARHLAPRISASCAGCHPFRTAPGVWK